MSHSVKHWFGGTLFTCQGFAQIRCSARKIPCPGMHGNLVGKSVILPKIQHCDPTIGLNFKKYAAQFPGGRESIRRTKKHGDPMPGGAASISQFAIEDFRDYGDLKN